MLIHNVSCNQNFGMSLKIQPGAEKYLRKLSVEQLEKLKKLGEEFSNYKYVDLTYNNSGKFILNLKQGGNKYSNPSVNLDTSHIQDAYDYFGKSIAVEPCVTLKGEWEGAEDIFHKNGQSVSNTYNMHSVKAAQDLVKNFGKAHDFIDRIAVIARAFEQKFAIDEKMFRSKSAKHDKIANLTDDLMNKFGV